MNVGMKAAVQAAKTVAENGQQTSSFIRWFAKPCGEGKYVDKINKIFDPLSNVPDSVVPRLGCKTKKCSGSKKEPGEKGKGGQPPGTKDSNPPSSRKDQPPSTKAQPTATSTQPKPSSTSCSAKAAPSCTRVCTLVAKSSGGTTTTCATPSCHTVTKCSATATTTTTFTSAASASICDASCSDCKAKRARSTSPPGPSQLVRRALIEIDHYRTLEEFVERETRHAGANVLDDSTRMENGETVGTSSAKLIAFGNSAFNTAIQGLWGCTAVLVMSDRAIWFSSLLGGTLIHVCRTIQRRCHLDHGAWRWN